MNIVHLITIFAATLVCTCVIASPGKRNKRWTLGNEPCLIGAKGVDKLHVDEKVRFRGDDCSAVKCVKESSTSEPRIQWFVCPVYKERAKKFCVNPMYRNGSEKYFPGCCGYVECKAAEDAIFAFSARRPDLNHIEMLQIVSKEEQLTRRGSGKMLLTKSELEAF